MGMRFSLGGRTRFYKDFRNRGFPIRMAWLTIAEAPPIVAGNEGTPNPKMVLRGDTNDLAGMAVLDGATAERIVAARWRVCAIGTSTRRVVRLVALGRELA